MAIPGSPASLLPAGDYEFARRLRDAGRSLTELGPSIAASIKPPMDDIRAQQAIRAGLVADLTTAEATLATTVSGLTTAQATTVSTLTAAVADIAALASWTLATSKPPPSAHRNGRDPVRCRMSSTVTHSYPYTRVAHAGTGTSTGSGNVGMARSATGCSAIVGVMV